MDRKKLLKLLASLIFFILVTNFFANQFYWYYSIWYFDMIMHFLGGFWVGLLFFYLFYYGNLVPKSIFYVFLWVLAIGISWEVFEFCFYNYIAQNAFNLFDTSSDIFFDLFGGAFAVLYFLKRIMRTERNEVK